MKTHIMTAIALTLALFSIGGCSGGSGSGDNSGSSSSGGEAAADTAADTATAITLVPLYQEVADKLCSLKSYSTIDDMIVRFGQPTQRTDAAGTTILRWKGDGWAAQAMFSNGNLALASAYSYELQPGQPNAFKNHNTYIAGQTTLPEIESHHGPATLIAVQWHKGTEVTASIRNRPDFDNSITRDRCSELYAWGNLDMKKIVAEQTMDIDSLKELLKKKL